MRFTKPHCPHLQKPLEARCWTWGSKPWNPVALRATVNHPTPRAGAQVVLGCGHHLGMQAHNQVWDLHCGNTKAKPLVLPPL